MLWVVATDDCVVWYLLRVVWCGVVWCGVVWCGVVCQLLCGSGMMR